MPELFSFQIKALDTKLAWKLSGILVSHLQVGDEALQQSSVRVQDEHGDLADVPADERVLLDSLEQGGNGVREEQEESTNNFHRRRRWKERKKELGCHCEGYDVMVVYYSKMEILSGRYKAEVVMSVCHTQLIEFFA